MADRDESQGWHLGRTIDLGHVLTTTGMLVALFFFINDFDDRVDLLEFKSEAMTHAIDREHEYVKEVLSKIERDLEYIRKRMEGHTAEKK